MRSKSSQSTWDYLNMDWNALRWIGIKTKSKMSKFSERLLRWFLYASCSSPSNGMPHSCLSALSRALAGNWCCNIADAMRKDGEDKQRDAVWLSCSVKCRCSRITTEAASRQNAQHSIAFWTSATLRKRKTSSSALCSCREGSGIVAITGKGKWKRE